MSNNSLPPEVREAPKTPDLPVIIEEGLQQLCEQLRDTLGEQLVSVILYGGLTKGEYIPRSSDVNVMIVLHEANINVAVLDAVAGPIQLGMRDYGLDVLLLSEKDLQQSTDVFPIKFLDIQRYHRLVWGKDVVADLHIAEDHLRLRCEQEIKNLCLRLRHFYLERVRQPERIEQTLTHAISSFLISLSAVLVLKSGQSPISKRAIAEAAARELGIAEQPLLDILALKSGDTQPDVDALKQLYNAFMETVQKAADIVDHMSV